MLNVPTDLLRTLVTVVDLRSFTKAAQTLGVTQPAVSAQIKRLQHLLGYDVLDKRVPGVSLTPRGEIVVTHARRLLSINDEILQSTSARPMTQTLRVGIPGDYSGSRIPSTLARFRLRFPAISFNVSTETAENLIRDLKQGDLDVILAVSNTEPPIKARHQWMRQAIWVRGDALRLDPHRPVPLVAYGEDCACQRVAVAALNEAGRDCEFVFTSRSLTSLVAAVAAGFGVMVMPRGRAVKTNLTCGRMRRCRSCPTSIAASSCVKAATARCWRNWLTIWLPTSASSRSRPASCLRRQRLHPCCGPPRSGIDGKAERLKRAPVSGNWNPPWARSRAPPGSATPRPTRSSARCRSTRSSPPAR